MPSRQRLYQVAERIKEILATELVEIADPRFYLVTLTGVKLSSDMREAKIYWSTLSKENQKAEIDLAFTGAEGLFKTALAKKLKARFVPNVKFFYDDTFETQEMVETLLERIKTKN